MEEKAKKNWLHIWLNPGELEQVTEACQEQGLSKQTLIRKLILEELQRHHLHRITQPWARSEDKNGIRRLARVKMPTREGK